MLSLIILGCIAAVVSGQCPVGCNDNPPEPDVGEIQYSCQDQKLFGQCNADFMMGYCECTCRTCAIAVEEKAVLSTALDLAGGTISVDPYPFLDEMTCIQLLSTVKAEADYRYEFEVFQGLDTLTNHPEVQQCIDRIDINCAKNCCKKGTQKCGCNSKNRKCKWMAYNDISVQYMGLAIFENSKNKLCKCPLPQ